MWMEAYRLPIQDKMMDNLEDQDKPKKELNPIWDWPNTGLREHHRERFERLKVIVLAADFKKITCLESLPKKNLPTGW